MQTRSNEQLCALAQKGDAAARDLLLENNLGFIRKTANELYQSMNLSESNLCLDDDDLIQEGSIGLLNAVSRFDDSRGMKFLTYAAPAIRNAMIDFVRAEVSQFETKISEKDGLGFRIIRLEDILSEENQMQRIEAIAHPFVLSPEEIYIKKEEIGELYQALRELNDREQTYLLYRFGFSDDIEHPLIGTAVHFHLTESRAKRTEKAAMEHLRSKLLWWF